MTKREAALIPEVSPTANRSKIREAHRHIVLLMHPEKGGSPAVVAKINEAKDLLEDQAKKMSEKIRGFDHANDFFFFFFFIKGLRKVLMLVGL